MAGVLLFVSGQLVDDRIFQPSESVDSSLLNVITYEVDETGATVAEGWRYGPLDAVAGAPGLILPLYSVGDAGAPGAGNLALRNLLFVDAGLQESHWLLSDNERTIAHYESVGREEDEVARAILYEVQDRTTADTTPSEKSRHTSIYLSRPDGRALTRLVADADRCIGHALVDEAHLAILYLQGETAYAARVALANLAVIETVALPPIE
jgi:hypothetical protein